MKASSNRFSLPALLGAIAVPVLTFFGTGHAADKEDPAYTLAAAKNVLDIASYNVTSSAEKLKGQKGPFKIDYTVQQGKPPREGTQHIVYGCTAGAPIPQSIEVCDSKDVSHGICGKLGDMFKRASDALALMNTRTLDAYRGFQDNDAVNPNCNKVYTTFVPNTPIIAPVPAPTGGIINTTNVTLEIK